MAVKPCLDCGKEVSTSADKCPHCGSAVPNTGTMWSILFALAGTALAAWWLYENLWSKAGG